MEDQIQRVTSAQLPALFDAKGVRSAQQLWTPTNNQQNFRSDLSHLRGSVELNIAEIELSALNGQCLHRRLPDIKSMRREISAWQNHRNTRGAPINWRFTTQDAGIKLLRLYPQL